MSLVAIKQATKEVAIRKSFEDILGQRAAGFLSSIVSCAASNKQLAECDPISVVRAASIAAILDLPIAPGLGFAWIVPYRNVATFQLGWKGYVQLALRTGQYSRMHATAVYPGQIKSFNHLTGDIDFDGTVEPQGEPIGYCFYFRMLNGFERYHYMTRAQCEAHGKRYSQSFKKGYGLWVDDFEAMALKTVVKQSLSKWGILSVEMQKALTYDGAEVLDIDSGEHRFPDNQVTAESSAEALELMRQQKPDYIPGIEPPMTCEQFFESVMKARGGLTVLETTMTQLESAGHKAYSDKLLELYKQQKETKGG